MGGFKPSRADIDSSTAVGADITLDSHQLTGSVDITGSLTLNGSAITGGGGGGGAVSTYTNSGNDRVITSVNSSTINGEANFTFDGTDLVVSDNEDAKANIGRALIGYDGTNSDYATFAHRDKATSANFALQQRADGTTVVNTPTGGTLSLRVGNNNALVVAGASNNNIGINTGTPLARLHVSASSAESDVLRIDGTGTNTNSLYVSGSGRVGIGTMTPTAQLHVSSSVAGDANLLFRVDHGDHTSDNPIMSITGSGHVGIGTATPGYALHVADDTNAFLVESEGGSDWFSVAAGTVSFNAAGGVTNAGGIDLGQRFNIAPINATAGALGIGQYEDSDKNVLEVNSANSDEGGDWFLINQSGAVGIGTTNPASTLEVQGDTAISGALAMSGTFTTPSISTMAGEMGTINADRAVTVIDATGLDNNAVYTYGIANGTTAGQRKDLILKVNCGGTILTSNAIQVTGSNILATSVGSSNGMVVLSGSVFDGNLFVSRQGGASLMWDGSDWTVVSANNAQHF